MRRKKFHPDYSKEIKKAIPWLAAAVVAFFAVLPRQASSEIQLLEDSGALHGSASEESQLMTAEEEPLAPESIFVDVAGAVTEPGVFELVQGARVYQAIDAAGGLTGEGDTREVNLAAVLQDGQKIYIPTQMEMKQQQSNISAIPGSSYIPGRESDASESVSAGGKVNINTDSASELTKLSGVGPSTAERILQYRCDHGDFSKIEDLKQVKGIGEKTYEKLKEYIYVP